MKNTRKQILKKKAWKIFSEYIRRRDKGVCYTCGVKKEWKQMQAGHFKHGVLDLDERNIKTQCLRCNHFLSGNLSVYAIKLLQNHGKKWLEKLHNDAKKALGGEIYDEEYYQKIIDKYKKLLIKLEDTNTSDIIYD